MQSQLDIGTARTGIFTCARGKIDVGEELSPIEPPCSVWKSTRYLASKIGQYLALQVAHPIILSWAALSRVAGKLKMVPRARYRISGP
jgi:hypothetical protein